MNARPATAAASSLVIVPIGDAVPIVAPPVGADSATVKLSSISTAVSPPMSTMIEALAWPSAKVTVPVSGWPTARSSVVGEPGVIVYDAETAPLVPPESRHRKAERGGAAVTLCDARRGDRQRSRNRRRTKRLALVDPAEAARRRRLPSEVLIGRAGAGQAQGESVSGRRVALDHADVGTGHAGRGCSGRTGQHALVRQELHDLVRAVDDREAVGRAVLEAGRVEYQALEAVAQIGDGRHREVEGAVDGSRGGVRGRRPAIIENQPPAGQVRADGRDDLHPLRGVLSQIVIMELVDEHGRRHGKLPVSAALRFVNERSRAATGWR